MLARFLRTLAGRGYSGQAPAKNEYEASDIAARASPVDAASARPQVERALALLERGRTTEAAKILRSVPEVDLVDPGALVRLGLACQRIGMLDIAEAYLRRANGETLPGAGIALAGLLFARQRTDECAALCSTLCATELADAAPLTLLALCRQREGQSDAALALLRRASVLPAVAWPTLFHLGSMLRIQGHWDESIAVLREARRLCPRDQAFSGATHLALAYDATGNRDAALVVLEEELALRPSVDAHRTYAQMLLKQGRMVEAWPHYEYRWLAEPLVGNRMQLPIPEWKGQSLAGRQVLLRVEQGFGDAFQFLRYAPLLRQQGATVAIAPFCDLAPRFAGIDRVLDGPVDPGEVDYFVNLLSLPKAFATDASSIPCSVPYVAPDADKVAQWRRRLGRHGSKAKVGIVWAGNPGHPGDRERSMPLGALQKLLTSDEVTFFSLQKGLAASELRNAEAKGELIDLGPELLDFGDTAAVLVNLDLLICVDTSVAHLAGALGRPAWVLLGTPSDWRWQDERGGTPWYPTIRLFRQSVPGEWSDVIDRVAHDLGAYVAGSMVSDNSAESVPVGVPDHASSLPAGYASSREAIVHTNVGMMQCLVDACEEGRSLDWYGEYLQSNLDVILGLVRPGGTGIVLEGGLGSHPIALSRRVGDGGLLILTESRPDVHRLLGQNLLLHACSNVTLLPCPRYSGRGSTGIAEAMDDLDRLDFIVFGDCGGFPALAILEEASRTIWGSRPLLVLRLRDESSSRSATPSTCSATGPGECVRHSLEWRTSTGATMTSLGVNVLARFLPFQKKCCPTESPNTALRFVGAKRR